MTSQLLIVLLGLQAPAPVAPPRAQPAQAPAAARRAEAAPATVELPRHRPLGRSDS